MRGLVWEEFEEGQCSDKAAHLVEDALKECMDNTGKEIALFESMYSSFTGSNTLKFWMKMQNWPCCGGLARGYVIQHLTLIYEMCSCSVLIMNKCKEYLPTFPLPKKLSKSTILELDKNIKQSQDYLNTISNEFTDIIQAIQTKRATNMILNLQKKYVRKVYKQGYMDDITYHHLRKQFDRKLINLKVEAPNMNI